MADKKIFKLPDLGEGLPDATIVQWAVKEGENIRLDENLVSMETAKAVVEIPSPVSGKILTLAGVSGDVIETGAMLAEFEIDPDLPQRAEGQDTGHHHSPQHTNDHQSSLDTTDTEQHLDHSDNQNSGTVVGTMEFSNAVHSDKVSSAGGVKAMPAVRAMAHKFKINLNKITATGKDSAITMEDVKQAMASTHSTIVDVLPSPHDTKPATQQQPAHNAIRSTLSQSGKPMRTQPPSARTNGQPAQLKGIHRNMARVMAKAHAEVVPTTLCDDADLHAWIGKQDITVRLIRAIVSACKEVPILNSWFDGEKLSITQHPHVDIGVAVDTEDGLIVPILRNADMFDSSGMRDALDRLYTQTKDRSIPSADLTGHTISLSNFGMFAGRYATPVVVPPTVAIVASGRLSHDVIAVIGGIEVHRRIPISLTFDHRAATGGQAARFLKVLLNDLSAPS